MREIKIITYNVNGIRAAVKNGLLVWLEQEQPDVLCLQEIKVSAEDFDAVPFENLGYECYLFPAEKKGYSGVAIFTKLKGGIITKGIGISEYDKEGRNIRLDIGDWSVMSAYFPSGTTGDERQSVKMKYLDDMFRYLHELSATRKQLIICGDYNICHQAIDIHDPVRNKDTSGFKPEERAWMEKYFSSGFTDVFRYFFPEKKDEYSWWSYRAGARKNNKGWRIDYIVITNNLRSNLKQAKIMQDAVHSDHCPVCCKISLSS